MFTPAKTLLPSVTFMRLTLLTLSSTLGMASYAAIDAPILDNTAYVLMDYDTGTILAQQNADQPLPPASLTKMMTSYLIEQRLLSGNLKETDPVTMSPNAWCKGTSEESCMYVPVNSTAPVIDMLKGIIIQSGNDAAKAMAEHIAGSEGAFSDLMNEEAKKIGMTNSHFVNATGMPTQGHNATAYDMAKLSQAIIKNSQKYYPIYSQKEFTYNNIKQGNRNVLLASDPTVDGLKTGHTDEAGYCLAVSSKRGDMRLISVIFGTKSSQARADQSRELLNWGFGHFTTQVVAPTNQTVGKSMVSFGKSDAVNVATKNSLQVLIPKIQAQKIQTQINLPKALKAPLKKGQEVGTMTAVLDGKTVASVPLVAMQDVEAAGFFSRMVEYVVGFFKGLF